MEIVGKTAVVTGASAGIGNAIALRLAREGAAVVLADVDQAGGRETEGAIGTAGGHATFIRADMANEADVDAMMRMAESAHGGLDILVNNAGFAVDPPYPDADPATWRRLLDVNLAAVMLATQRALASMRARGGGVVVNVSSVAGLGLGRHAAPDYAASKAAVVRLTAALASLAEENIRVNCVCPDWVDTPAVRRTLAGMGQKERKDSAPVRLVPPEDIAEVVVRFIRDDSLAGRVMACPCEGEWELLPAG